MSEHSRVWLLSWTTRVTEFNLLIKKHLYVCVCVGAVLARQFLLISKLGNTAILW